MKRYSTLFGLALLILSLLVSSVPVSAITQEDLDAINKNYIFYDDDTTPLTCGGLGSGTGDFSGTNEEIIWNYYRSRGLNEYATAGILGNFYKETDGTFDPAIRQYNGGPGRGLAQWETPGRWDNLLDWAAFHNLDPIDIMTQLHFSWIEMTGEEPPGFPDSGAGIDGGSARAYERFQTVAAVDDATVIFARFYERNRDSIRYGNGEITYEAAFGERIGYALEAYATFTGNPILTSQAGCDNTASSGQIVGDPEETSVDIACAAGTIDLGIHTGYSGGDPVEHRLCALPNLRSSSSESQPGSTWYVEGADGYGIVNSRVSGAWFTLINTANADGIQLGAVSTFRTLEHQRALYNNCISDPGCTPGTHVASPGNSPHQSAHAIDFNWGGGSKTSGRTCSNPSVSSSSGYLWMVDNAYRFGFAQYVNEHWHWDARTDSSRCSFNV